MQSCWRAQCVTRVWTMQSRLGTPLSAQLLLGHAVGTAASVRGTRFVIVPKDFPEV
jgi:hypothetical protein